MVGDLPLAFHYVGVPRWVDVAEDVFGGDHPGNFAAEPKTAKVGLLEVIIGVVVGDGETVCQGNNDKILGPCNF